MGIKDWVTNIFKPKQQITLLETDNSQIEQFFDSATEAYIREMAFWSCVNTVANAVSKCEFKTYAKNREVKGDEYYLWNYEPNQNQSSTMFLHKLIAQLYKNNEALVIELNGKLLVADSFGHTEYALYPDTFDNVVVGTYSFNAKFSMNDVLYFKLNECNMKSVANGLYNAYNEMIQYAMAAYKKSRGSKGILDVDAKAQGADNFEDSFKKLMNEHFKTFFSNDSAVLPLFEGYKYTEIGTGSQSENTRDIRSMIDDVLDMTARSFGIPPALLNGKVEGTKEAVDHLLTFCVDPLCDMLQEEINRKRYGDKVLGGDYLKIDTTCIKHIDLFDSSEAIDKLIGSAAFCINDIRIKCGETIIDEPWAWQHFITKNYTEVDALGTMEGNG